MGWVGEKGSMNVDVTVGSVGMPVKIQDLVKFGLQINNKFQWSIFALIDRMKFSLNWVSSVLCLYLTMLVGRDEERKGMRCESVKSRV